MANNCQRPQHIIESVTVSPYDDRRFEMATRNPFQDDSRAEIWELGYLSGFGDADVPPDPVPDPVDVFQAGFESGAADRMTGPAAGEGWLKSLIEFATEEALLHAVGVGIEKVGVGVGGVIGLVLSVVTIPGDVMLKPLEEDFAVPPDREGDIYVPICPRKDHGLVFEGVTPNGYWIGPASNDFLSAGKSCEQHGHSAAFVALCAPKDHACGPIWPVAP